MHDSIIYEKIEITVWFLDQRSNYLFFKSNTVIALLLKNKKK